MILSPLLKLQLNRKLCGQLLQSRFIRPTIKIAKEKFQLSIDVRNYDKDEIRIKARQESLIIEGKQEKKTKTGFVLRRFRRKFKLPNGCDVKEMRSNLSPDGILTVSAPRKICEDNLPCETLIPISHSGKSGSPSQVQKGDLVSICTKFDMDKPGGKKAN